MLRPGWDLLGSVDFEGEVIVEGERFTSALAVRGNRVAMEDSGAGFGGFSIMDLGTGARSAPADTGDHAPKHVSLLGELVVVLTGDWKAQVYLVPDVI